MKTLAAAGVVLGTIVSVVRAQAPPEPPARFPSAVEEVIVDVVVSDRAGAPVGGLRRVDFVLAEDGIPQTIASFEAVEIAPSGPDRDPLEAPPSVSANPAAGGRPAARTFLVVFDDLRLTPAQGESAKKALREFLSTRAGDADNVLLVTTTGSTVWGTRLADGRADVEALIEELRGRFQPEVVFDSVSESEAYRIEVRRDAETFYHVLRRMKRTAPRMAGAPPATDVGFLDGAECTDARDPDKPILCAAARATHQRGVARLRDTLGILERALAALEGVRGRKAAVLVSPGFYYDTELVEFRRVAEASRRANVPVHFLNAQGLPDLPIEMTAQVGGVMAPGDATLAFRESRDAAAGADIVATDTGGTVVRNTNNLAKGLRRIADEAQRYYLIGYTPTNTARDGKYRKIEVTLAAAGAAAATRGDLEVWARRGYYAPREERVPVDADEPVRAALASPFDLSGLPLRLAAYALEEKSPGRVRCLLVGEVDVRSFAFREEEGRLLAALDLAFVTRGRNGGTTEHAQRVDMRLQPATRERLLRDGYVVSHEVELPPGVHQVRMVAREAGSGRVGSVSRRIDVPAPGSFRVSTPLVSDLLERLPKGTPPRVLPMARRAFDPGSRVFLSLEVFGAERDRATGRPRVSMGCEVRRPGGEILKHLGAKPIEPAPDGVLRRLVGFELDDGASGEYRIEGEVVDEVTGRTLLFTESFTVRAAAGGSGS